MSSLDKLLKQKAEYAKQLQSTPQQTQKPNLPPRTTVTSSPFIKPTLSSINNIKVNPTNLGGNNYNSFGFKQDLIKPKLPQAEFRNMTPFVKKDIQNRDDEWGNSPFATMNNSDIALRYGKMTENDRQTLPESVRIKASQILDNEIANNRNTDVGKTGSFGAGMTSGLDTYTLGIAGAVKRAINPVEARQIELNQLDHPTATNVGMVAGWLVPGGATGMATKGAETLLKPVTNVVGKGISKLTGAKLVNNRIANIVTQGAIKGTEGAITGYGTGAIAGGTRSALEGNNLPQIIGDANKEGIYFGVGNAIAGGILGGIKGNGIFKNEINPLLQLDKRYATINDNLNRPLPPKQGQFPNGVKYKNLVDTAPKVETPVIAPIVEDMTKRPITDIKGANIPLENNINELPMTRDINKRNSVKNNIFDIFNIKRTTANNAEINQLTDNIIKEKLYNGGISEESINKLIKLGEVEQPIEQNIAQARNFIQGSKFNIGTSDKSSIPDYYAFIRNNRGNLTFSNKGVQADEVWNELNRLHPEIFPDNIQNPAEQLQYISDFMKKTNKNTIGLDEHYGTNLQDFKNYAISKLENDLYNVSEPQLPIPQNNPTSTVNSNIGKLPPKQVNLPQSQNIMSDVPMNNQSNMSQADNMRQDTERLLFGTQNNADVPINGQVELPPANNQSFGKNTVGGGESNPNSYSAMQNTYGTIKPGENPVRVVDVPTQTADGKYVSKFARTMQEAGVTPQENISDFEKAIVEGKMSYDPITDKMAQATANKVIITEGTDGAMAQWQSAVDGNSNMTKHTFALGQTLYNQAITSGDTKTAMRLASDLVLASRTGAQITQASRMLKKMTPDGQLYHIEKSVQKINEELLGRLKGKAPNVTIDETLATKLLNAKDKTEIDNVVDEITQDVAKQIPASWQDKWNAWRYLAMLGNPRTHIRNIVGNAIFVPARQMKNIIGTALEKTLPQADRTKAIFTSKENINFAKNDFMNDIEAIKGDNKFDMSKGIQDNQKVFNNPILEKLRTTNFNALEKEDVFFLKGAYTDSFAKAMTAKGVTANYLSSGTKESNEVLASIRAYATKEAQKATFRDASALASFLNGMSRKINQSNSKFGKLAGNIALEGTLPFKKTPVNILKRSIEYSPIELVKGMTNVFTKVRKGTMNANEALDQISSGMVGTSVLGLGAFLAGTGILKAGTDDDKGQGMIDNLTGKQSYSLNFGDKSYTIDWAAPIALPLFVGAEIYNMSKNGNVKTSDVINAFSRITEPLFELSMLQGVSGLINSAKYSQGQPITDLAVQTGVNYFGQAIPTIAGQVARTIDPTRRTTYNDKNSQLPKPVDTFIQRNQAKIPFASQSLPAKLDQWGNEIKGQPNAGVRAFENFLSPGYIGQNKDTPLNNEIQRIYKATSENGVVPKPAPKFFTVDGKRVDLSAQEYTQFAKSKGQKSFTLANSIINDDRFKKLADVDKASVIGDVYEYAGANAKTEVSNYKLDSWYVTAKEADDKGKFTNYILERKLKSIDSKNNTKEKLFGKPKF